MRGGGGGSICGSRNGGFGGVLDGVEEQGEAAGVIGVVGAGDALPGFLAALAVVGVEEGAGFDGQRIFARGERGFPF